MLFLTPTGVNLAKKHTLSQLMQILPSSSFATSSQARQWPAVVDELEAGGILTFSREDAERLGPKSRTGLVPGLRRLQKKRRIVALGRGLYAIVPLAYRDQGGPPPSWFIDAMMRHIEQPYYVGLLTAAALHGAAHQPPMAFQVLVERPFRPARVGRAEIEFHQVKHVRSAPCVEMVTETGAMRVSTPEITALDLVHFARASGHLSHVTTVLEELTEEVDGRALLDAARLYPTPTIQRLGYLLQLLEKNDVLTHLPAILGERRVRPVLLSTDHPQDGAPLDPEWKVFVNVDVEPDL